MEENVITLRKKETTLLIQTFSAALHSEKCQRAVNMLISDQRQVSFPNLTVTRIIKEKWVGIKSTTAVTY